MCLMPSSELGCPVHLSIWLACAHSCHLNPTHHHQRSHCGHAFTWITARAISRPLNWTRFGQTYSEPHVRSHPTPSFPAAISRPPTPFSRSLIVSAISALNPRKHPCCHC